MQTRHKDKKKVNTFGANGVANLIRGKNRPKLTLAI